MHRFAKTVFFIPPYKGGVFPETPCTVSRRLTVAFLLIFSTSLSLCPWHLSSIFVSSVVKSNGEGNLGRFLRPLCPQTDGSVIALEHTLIIVAFNALSCNGF